MSFPQPGPGQERDSRRILAAWHEAVDSQLGSVSRQGVVGVGFSLGGLLLARTAAASERRPIKGLVMIAPPLFTTLVASAVRLLTPLGRLGVSLPSRTPPAVRRHDRTGLSSYQAMLRSARETRVMFEGGPLADLPVRVVVSRSDPVVGYKRLERWIDRNGLDSWSVQETEVEPTTPPYLAHLLIHPDYVGSQTFERVVDIIEECWTEVDHSTRDS